MAKIGMARIAARDDFPDDFSLLEMARDQVPLTQSRSESVWPRKSAGSVDFRGQPGASNSTTADQPQALETAAFVGPASPAGDWTDLPYTLGVAVPLSDRRAP